MTKFTFSRAAVRRQATAESFQRWESYYQGGAVTSLVRRGNAIQAEVEGSQYEPYRVHVTFDEGGVIGVACSCPYDWGGWCKHIVAALLACIEEPDSVEERPSIDEMLIDLDRDQLQDLLLHLATRDAYLADEIAGQIELLRSPVPDSRSDVPPSRRTPVDPKPIARQVRATLHSLDHMRRSEAYWHVGDVVDQVGHLLGQIRDFIEGGDGNNALVLLEAVTQEYVKGWLYLDDSDGYAGGFFRDLGEAWTEACLVADLSPEERERWAQRLAR